MSEEGTEGWDVMERCRGAEVFWLATSEPLHNRARRVTLSAWRLLTDRGRRLHAHSITVLTRSHTAPVWQLAWAHPSFGSILASCSYDGRVFIWKEVGLGAGKGTGGEVQDGWERIKEHSLHTASGESRRGHQPIVTRYPTHTSPPVNSIAWAPYDLGPILACASSDGKISVINFQNDGSTDASVFAAHGTGANAISWAPSAGGAGKRFVSAGSDNLIKIWAWDDEAKKWAEEETIREHEDWVRDVAWAPNIGLPGTYIASASQVSASERTRQRGRVM